MYLMFHNVNITCSHYVIEMHYIIIYYCKLSKCYTARSNILFAVIASDIIALIFTQTK